MGWGGDELQRQIGSAHRRTPSRTARGAREVGKCFLLLLGRVLSLSFNASFFIPLVGVALVS